MKRYDLLKCGDCANEMEESEFGDGDWVKFEDVKTELEAKGDATKECSASFHRKHQHEGLFSCPICNCSLW